MLVSVVMLERRRVSWAAGKAKRAPFADRKGPLEHLWPRNLVVSSAHAAVFTLAPMLAAATPPESEDEEVLLDWDILSAELRDFKSKFVKTLFRVLGCTSLKRLLEACCVEACARKTAIRLLKDPVKSALRKAGRAGRGVAALKMLRTAAYANALTYVSNFVVEEAVLLWRLGRRRRVVRQSTSLLVGFGAAYACSTCGIALGTLLKPGWGTVLGAAFGDIASLLILEPQQQHPHRHGD
ncbi:hypothetical protein CTAYLR_008437 [Chrysophaeum taylorii]|uniref:Uncharacterized protein n=1 Tax=Chrysophaeum taylorii TaxID=2483200 RepID=A0AAD7XNN4_9STRA|nr:hypothetical protein CTAYLR_008437 [Chrysophaeum taylorii]